VKLDDEARDLAWKRAEEKQGTEVVFAGYSAEREATRPDPTAILDEYDPSDSVHLPQFPGIAFPSGTRFIPFAKPDPTAILDQPAQLTAAEIREAFAAVGAVADMMVEAFRPIIQAFAQIAEDLVAAFQAVDWPALAQPPAPSSRVGYSCPRHGWQTTTWGCRRCQRGRR
jgi:hypothetical protein